MTERDWNTVHMVCRGKYQRNRDYVKDVICDLIEENTNQQPSSTKWKRDRNDNLTLRVYGSVCYDITIEQLDCVLHSLSDRKTMFVNFIGQKLVNCTIDRSGTPSMCFTFQLADADVYKR